MALIQSTNRPEVVDWSPYKERMDPTIDPTQINFSN
jgi:hypothetical protein